MIEKKAWILTTLSSFGKASKEAEEKEEKEKRKTKIRCILVNRF